MNYSNISINYWKNFGVLWIRTKKVGTMLRHHLSVKPLSIGGVHRAQRHNGTDSPNFIQCSGTDAGMLSSVSLWYAIQLGHISRLVSNCGRTYAKPTNTKWTEVLRYRAESGIPFSFSSSKRCNKCHQGKDPYRERGSQLQSAYFTRTKLNTLQTTGVLWPMRCSIDWAYSSPFPQ